MAWPLASHFSAMLQQPRLAFRDPVLQQCLIERNAHGQPRPWSGSFAVVYKATDQQGRNPFAVRVFTTESPERRERYEQISAYLNERRLGCLCAFEYRDAAIRSAGDGKWYPLILMEWVQGDTLFQWVRARSLEGNARALAEAAEKWIGVAEELAGAAVAHGDLQHANVMVDERGQLKLVDYDCLCVPALLGRRNQELGVDPYQHPARNGGTLLSLSLDHFSELVIYTALRALAAAPALWQKHVEATGYDKLLFRSNDLRSPSSSALYRDLESLPDAGVRRLANRLCELTRAPMEQVPPLGQVAGSCSRSAAPGRDAAAARLLASGPTYRNVHGSGSGPAKHPLPPPGRARLDRQAEVPATGGAVRPPAAPGPARNDGPGGSRPAPPTMPGRMGAKSGSRPAPPPLRPGSMKGGSRPAPPPLSPAAPGGGSRPAPPARLPWVDTSIPAIGKEEAAFPVDQAVDLPPTFLEAMFSRVTRPEVAWTSLGFGATGFAMFIILLGWRLWPAPAPPVAAVPFAAEQARNYQQAWAAHRAVPVEKTNSIGMKLRLIPPGEFVVGRQDDEGGGPSDGASRRRVKIAQPFYLGVYEVTQGQYEQVVGSNPSYFSPNGAGADRVADLDTSLFPVESVSWNDAVEFCERLSQLPEERSAGRTYRLPTEAEWEYACRAGTTTPFHFGNTLNCRLANCAESYLNGSDAGGDHLNRPAPVGSYSDNAFGIFDMHGNVSEYCKDPFSAKHDPNPRKETPPTLNFNAARVVRGGSWADPAERCQSGHREGLGADARNARLGFRVVLVGRE